MSDFQLAYGPGGSVAVLRQSLKALAFKLKLRVEVDEQNDVLVDALRLHLTPKAGAEASRRLAKALGTSFPVFQARNATLSVALDDTHTVVLEVAPVKAREEYKALIQGFTELVGQCFAPDAPDARETALAGAHWVDGRARLVFEGEGNPLRWA